MCNVSTENLTNLSDIIFTNFVVNSAKHVYSKMCVQLQVVRLNLENAQLRVRYVMLMLCYVYGAILVLVENSLCYAKQYLTCTKLPVMGPQHLVKSHYLV